MSTITSFEESSHVRRRLLPNGTITFAVAAIVAIGFLKAQSSRGRVSQIKPGIGALYLCNLAADATSTRRFHALLGDEGAMPDLDRAIGWLNSPSLSPKSLRGKGICCK